MEYLLALETIHKKLNPISYVEIGCRNGHSLSLSRCPSIGIDPNFVITFQLRSSTKLFRQTSDEFFAMENLHELLSGPVDLAFIDGMHRAEFVLRDILNLEAYASNQTVVVVDDVLPERIEWATRDRLGQAWTGDVYKIIPFLRKHRPDLDIRIYDIEMKGMAIITGFNPEDKQLQQNLAEHESYLEGETLAFSNVDDLRSELAPESTEAFSLYLESIQTNRKVPSFANKVLSKVFCKCFKSPM